MTRGEERSPQKIARTDPLIKVLRSAASNLKNDGDQSETKLFFPTRWIPVDAEELEPDHLPQLQDAIFTQETQSDRTHRNELIALIKRTCGFSVDKSCLQFVDVKDVHPFRDPLRAVRFMLSLLNCTLLIIRASALDLIPTLPTDTASVLIHV
ncbi:hypothetical protein DFH07DRAFT_809981 [Mycena maculata]|uniref:Uncharacterized protein n=1 Tax=Mycena maculata TaxID=230809 RepID=A0AAD7NLR1_9AGAR|nr:hypothetical protein DFH07DRAFT_809981 [Mycena maculata]